METSVITSTLNCLITHFDLRQVLIAFQRVLLQNPTVSGGSLIRQMRINTKHYGSIAFLRSNGCV